jgi:hypothetical protein
LSEEKALRSRKILAAALGATRGKRKASEKAADKVDYFVTTALSHRGPVCAI